MVSCREKVLTRTFSSAVLCGLYSPWLCIAEGKWVTYAIPFHGMVVEGQQRLTGTTCR